MAAGDARLSVWDDSQLGRMREKIRGVRACEWGTPAILKTALKRDCDCIDGENRREVRAAVRSVTRQKRLLQRQSPSPDGDESLALP